jgi:archaellum component FlaF (FlaF/FlaG flagellin family)
VIRRFSAYLDARPALAMLLGSLIAFLILYFAAPSLYERVEQPMHRSAT